MNNDYERYDFWHREMKSIRPTVSMEKLIESNRLFDEKNRKGFKYNPNESSEDIPNINQIFI